MINIIKSTRWNTIYSNAFYIDYIILSNTYDSDWIKLRTTLLTHYKLNYVY